MGYQEKNQYLTWFSRFDRTYNSEIVSCLFSQSKIRWHKLIQECAQLIRRGVINVPNLSNQSSNSSGEYDQEFLQKLTQSLQLYPAEHLCIPRQVYGGEDPYSENNLLSLDSIQEQLYKSLGSSLNFREHVYYFDSKTREFALSLPRLTHLTWTPRPRPPWQDKRSQDAHLLAVLFENLVCVSIYEHKRNLTNTRYFIEQKLPALQNLALPISMSLRKAELKPIQRFLESRIFNNLTLRETYFIERGTSPEIGVSLQNIRARNLTLRTYWERFDRHLRELNCESLQQLSLMGLTTTNLRPLSELIGRQSNIELKLNFGNPVLHKANADSTAAFQVLAKTPNLCQSLRSLKSHDIRSVAELDGIESLSSLRRLGLNFDSAFDFSTLSLSIFTAIAHLKLEKLTLSFWKLNIHLTLLSPFSGRGLFELTQCLMNKGASSSHSRLKAEKIKINQLESNKMEAVLQCFETSQLRILELRYRPIDLQQNAMDRYLAAVVRFLERCHNLSGFQIDLRGATKKSIAGILGSPCLKTCEEIGITVDEESLAWTTEFLKARPRTQFQEVTLRPTRFRRPPRWYFQP